MMYCGISSLGFIVRYTMFSMQYYEGTKKNLRKKYNDEK